MAISKKGKAKKTRIANRPLLNTKKQKKIKLLRKDEIAIQKKVAEEGLTKRAEVPKGNVSLQRENAEAFRKKNKVLKKKVLSAAARKSQTPDTRWKKTQKIKDSNNSLQDRPGLICITNLPHGFYEHQLQGYFSQFGDVSRVRLVRSKRTGRSCGYAYIEFCHDEVAKIAAKAMNNYLTFGKIMKCISMPYKIPIVESIFSKGGFGRNNCPKIISRANAICELNKPRTEDQIRKRNDRVRSSFSRKLRQLKELGVEVPVTLVETNMNMKEKENAHEEMPEVKNTPVINDNVSSVAVPKKTAKKRKSLELQEPKIPEVVESLTASKTPKKSKLNVPATATPKSARKSQKKNKNLPVKDEENSAVDVKEDRIVFEADESDEEISIKTPPFTKKKLVKITATSPAKRLTALHAENSNIMKKTPKKFLPKKTPKKSPKGKASE
ncbi:nucleolar protein [Halocaridina rubra]|uniref:Nucleolar protein n=1 Tax=Halocaridina rubra TaxID=373956 RepID=A0AAN8XFY3_HALRR